LPKYKQTFQAAGKKYDIDWTLLAAQAYQESHWNRYARSPTGVRGIMMLTLNTAREVGVKSRLNPQQSIYGGAKYLANLRARLPEEIAEPDRSWIALAAYNVGMGHIYDARKLAREQDKDPNLWHEFRDVLPLLTQKKYYKDLRYGYARGYEPVRYVRRIRNYHDMLLQALQINHAD
jgi:membrane-bound lytic murein transglycosylase F